MSDKIDQIFKSKYDETFKQVFFWDHNTAREIPQNRSIRSMIEAPSMLHRDDVFDAMRQVCIDMMNFLDEHEISKKLTNDFYGIKKENPED